MIDQSALALVLHDVSLIDRLNGTQSHRHCRELPVIRHQPRVGVRRETLASYFAPKVLQLRLADHALEVGARIHARRTVALVIHQIAGMTIRSAPKEVIHAHVIERGAGRKAGDVSAQAVFVVVGAHHHRHGVPADQ